MAWTNGQREKRRDHVFILQTPEALLPLFLYMRRKHRKLTVDETLEFLLDRGIISEKMSGGYIYEVHRDEFRFWSKNEAVCELSKYLGYGFKSHASRRAIDSCTEEFCIEWPKVCRHWEGEVMKIDIMSEASGIDLDGISHQTYHQLSSYYNKLRKRIPEDDEFREVFNKYVNRKIIENKDLRFKRCSTTLKLQDTAKSQS